MDVEAAAAASVSLDSLLDKHFSSLRRHMDVKMDKIMDVLTSHTRRIDALEFDIHTHTHTHTHTH